MMAIFFNVMAWFYNYGWFTGAISGAGLYYVICKFTPQIVFKPEFEKA